MRHGINLRVSPEFTTLFSASANASAALAGLLFLAVTVGSVPTVGPRAPVERRTVAASSFLALVNAFFLSMGALIPGANFGTIALPVGIVCFISTVRIGQELAAGPRTALDRVRRVVLVAVSGLLFAIESWQGLQLLLRPDDRGPVAVIASMLLPVYFVGIVRAWELLGAQRYSLLARLSPLRDLD